MKHHISCCYKLFVWFGIASDVQRGVKTLESTGMEWTTGMA